MRVEKKIDYQGLVNLCGINLIEISDVNGDVNVFTFQTFDQDNSTNELLIRGFDITETLYLNTVFNFNNVQALIQKLADSKYINVRISKNHFYKVYTP